MRWFFIVLLVVGTAVGVGAWFRQSTTDSPESSNKMSSTQQQYLGVSVSPKSFASEDVLNFYDHEAKQVGDMLTWVGDVEELDAATGAPHAAAQLAPDHDLVPTSIFVVRVEALHAPERVKKITQETIAYAKKYQPKFLGFGNEINFQYKDDANAFATFVTMFDAVADGVHAVSPDTKVFTVWALEWLRGLHGGLYGGMNDVSLTQWFLFDQFPKYDYSRIPEK